MYFCFFNTYLFILYYFLILILYSRFKENLFRRICSLDYNFNFFDLFFNMSYDLLHYFIRYIYLLLLLTVGNGIINNYKHISYIHF